MPGGAGTINRTGFLETFRNFQDLEIRGRKSRRLYQCNNIEIPDTGINVIPAKDTLSLQEHTRSIKSA